VNPLKAINLIGKFAGTLLSPKKQQEQVGGRRVWLVLVILGVAWGMHATGVPTNVILACIGTAGVFVGGESAGDFVERKNGKKDNQ